MEKESSVNPWHVSGDVDYNSLIKEFGTSHLDASIFSSKVHNLIKRGLYFSHRDAPAWVKDAQDKKQVSVLTGRGPSERMHLGHLIPFMAAQSLQKIYNCHVFIPLSEDEKFFVKPNLSIEQAKNFATENIIDIIALGFKQGKTHVIFDFEYLPLYKYAARMAKLITYSEAKAVFGLKPENNIGWSFYPAVQAAHILLPQLLLGPHKTIVPVGIDQDPFIRLTRDLAEHSSLKLIKPAALHSKFLPGLKGTAKMSSSDDDSSVIYLSDTPEEVKKKINKYAFSGGRDTLEEHRKYGGNPDIDVSFQYLKMIFETDDKTLAKIEKEYRAGNLLSGELKAITIDKINKFLKEHQKNRLKAVKTLSKFILKK